jgi:hypothetical protein
MWRTLNWPTPMPPLRDASSDRRRLSFFTASVTETTSTSFRTGAAGLDAEAGLWLSAQSPSGAPCSVAADLALVRGSHGDAILFFTLGKLCTRQSNENRYLQRQQHQ